MQLDFSDLPVFSSVEEAARSISPAHAAHITRLPVAGGDINETSILLLEDGTKLFCKENRRFPLSFFQAEAAGLQALAIADVLPVPTPLALGASGRGSFLLMECLEAGRPGPDFWAELGEKLALLHRAECARFTQQGKPYGFVRDNYIGATRQENACSASWTAFFRDRRLIPQLQQARDYFSEAEKKRFLWLLDHLDRFLAEPSGPSLLHGDLWAGNVFCDRKGKPWLVDPAVYFGHRETDLAMTELFGVFHERFYASYRNVFPLDSGYRDRVPVYNLYHLLNHLNLFGGSYLGSVLQTLDALVRIR